MDNYLADIFPIARPASPPVANNGSAVPKTRQLQQKARRSRRNEHLEETSRAFAAYMLANDSLRGELHDREALKAAFSQWKQEYPVPGSATNARYRGGFGEVFTRLRFGDHIAPMPKEGNASVVIWRQDANAGNALGNRRAAETQVRTSRKQFEEDRGGVIIQPAELFKSDLVYSAKTTISAKLDITNSNQQFPVLFLGATWLHRGGAQPQIAGIPAALPWSMSPGSSIRLTVTCTLPPGVWSNVLELKFSCEGYADGGAFSIARYAVLQGSNDPELAKQLAPKAPYKPRKRRRRVHQMEGPSGSKEVSSGGRWVIDVADYKIPRKFGESVALGELQDTLDALSGPRLAFDHYANVFQQLLWLEEMATERNMGTYDQYGVVLRRSGHNLLTITVPGLAEGRPSVLRGDKVFASLPSEPGRKYAGFARQVRLSEVDIHFHQKFFSKVADVVPVNICFTTPRTMERLQHDALATLSPSFQKVLFPTSGEWRVSSTKEEIACAAIAWKNPHLNEEQQEAVTQILLGACSPRPYIIFGPPGTGKTTTLIEAIVQLVRTDICRRVLVCAPSNAAADLLCIRLARAGLTKMEMVRDLAFSRSQKDVNERVQEYCNPFEDGAATPVTQELLGRRKVVVSTLSKAAKLRVMMQLEQGFFDAVVIDEAGQSPESETLAALVGLLDVTGGAGRLVLAGDPKQLGPVVQSRDAEELGLGISLLERLYFRL